MKKLVIFYSFEGNTKLIGENIAKHIEADILELKVQEEKTPKGFMKFFIGGKQVLRKEKPPLVPFDKSIEKYDLIFIGTPVWVGTYAPPLNTLFSKYDFSSKKMALFCCHGGGKGKIFSKMKDALGSSEILGEIDFQEPLKKNSENSISRSKLWSKEIIDKFEG